MPVFKNEDNGTWYVMARYVNWKGERKQKCKRGFATKREAQEWERMFKLQTSSDLDMSFEAFTELYINDVKNRLKENVAAGLFCRKMDGRFCRKKPDTDVRRAGRIDVAGVFCRSPVPSRSRCCLCHHPSACSLRLRNKPESTCPFQKPSAHVPVLRNFQSFRLLHLQILHHSLPSWSRY